jgi:hypothetical protein
MNSAIFVTGHGRSIDVAAGGQGASVNVVV